MNGAGFDVVRADHLEFYHYMATYKFGRNPDIDAAEDIIEQGGDVLYATLGVGQSLEVVSADAGDDFDVFVEGVDLNGYFVREYATLTGTTPVVLDTMWYSVFRARILTGSPAGVITWRPAGGGATWLMVAAGFRGTLFTAMTVPTNYDAFFIDWDVNMVRPAAAAARLEMDLLAKPSGQAGWVKESTVELYSDSGAYHHEFPVPMFFHGPVDLKVRCMATSATNIALSSAFSVILRTQDRSKPGPIEVNKP